jgi:hypothetical protein
MVATLLYSSGVDAAAEKASGPNDSAVIFPGTSSKEPISIDADKLVYYDKEPRRSILAMSSSFRVTQK